MLRLDHNDDASGIEVFYDRVGDLGGHAFLDLGPARVHIDNARKLREPADAPVRAGDVRDVRQQSLRAQTGLVSQDPFLFPGTIAENIAFAKPDTPMAAVEAAAR